MESYLPLALMILATAGLASVMMGLNYLFGPQRRSRVKGQPFECGNDPIGSNRHRINVKYAVVALLFIVFDIEVVFLFPWAVLFRELGVLGLVEMLIFLTVLVVGLVYVIRRGVLDWNPPPNTAAGRLRQRQAEVQSR